MLVGSAGMLNCNDLWYSRFLDRSACSRMIGDVEGGRIGVCIMKANDIRSAIGNVVSAVPDVADKIRSFLHFSVPDGGL